MMDVLGKYILLIILSFTMTEANQGKICNIIYQIIDLFHEIKITENKMDVISQQIRCT